MHRAGHPAQDHLRLLRAHDRLGVRGQRAAAKGAGAEVRRRLRETSLFPERADLEEGRDHRVERPGDAGSAARD